MRFPHVLTLERQADRDAARTRQLRTHSPLLHPEPRAPGAHRAICEGSCFGQPAHRSRAIAFWLTGFRKSNSGAQVTAYGPTPAVVVPGRAIPCSGDQIDVQQSRAGLSHVFECPRPCPTDDEPPSLAGLMQHPGPAAVGPGRQRQRLACDPTAHWAI